MLHPKNSVHALKPLNKILSLSPLCRKPTVTLRQVPPQAW
jgi:hypothetical protein